MTSSGSKVVQHPPHHPKVKGLNPGAVGSEEKYSFPYLKKYFKKYVKMSFN
jgi:hypothetical protein